MAAQAWKKFTTAMSNKRTNKQPSGNSSILKKGEVVVQRLSSDVQGKAQKYARIGPSEFVSFPYSDVTFNNLKHACCKHFESRIDKNMVCDILAGDQGPSCSSLEQIPSFNVIHVHFIESHAVDDDGFKSIGLSELPNSTSYAFSRQKKRSLDKSATSQPLPKKVRAKNPSTTTYPKSLLVLDMLKLETVIKGKMLRRHSCPLLPPQQGKMFELFGKEKHPSENNSFTLPLASAGTSTVLDLYEFNVATMTWSTNPMTVEFVVEEEVLGSGGFREVFKATSSTKSFAERTWVVKKYFAERTWVVKKYLPEAVSIIEKTKKNLEDHTRKVVQMHLLAKNFAEHLRKKLKEEKKLEQYGQTLKYRKVYMGQPGNVVVEEFVDGQFVKYINNTGEPCGDDSEVRCKAESLTHFSYEKSDGQLMIVDIQGCGHDLYDPEIASKELMGEGEELMFAAGNLAIVAIDNFVASHKCNKFCELLGLHSL